MVGVSVFGGVPTIIGHNSVIYYGPYGGGATQNTIFGVCAQYPYSNIFGVYPGSSQTGSSSQNGSSETKAPSVRNGLTLPQFNALRTVYTSYSSMLSSKKYEQIPQSITQYMALVKVIKTIDIADPIFFLLISIVSNILLGSTFANKLYASYAYNEIAIITLNKRIEEILSNVNNVQTSTGTGQFQVTQFVKLSPIYSYYVHLYGMPEFGIGFDPNKLAFLKTLPLVRARLNQLNNPKAESPEPLVDNNVSVPPTRRRRLRRQMGMVL